MFGDVGIRVDRAPGGRVRWEKTYSVVRLNEGVVDGDDLDVLELGGVAEDDSANATESVDADLDGSHFDDCSEDGWN